MPLVLFPICLRVNVTIAEIIVSGSDEQVKQVEILSEKYCTENLP